MLRAGFQCPLTVVHDDDLAVEVFEHVLGNFLVDWIVFNQQDGTREREVAIGAGANGNGWPFGGWGIELDDFNQAIEEL